MKIGLASLFCVCYGSKVVAVSERSKLIYELPVIDGYFGDTWDVIATQEGLEIDGYAEIPWEWIDYARSCLVPPEFDKQ